MCRNIRPLNNFEPPATRDEVTAAAPKDRDVEAAKARARAELRYAR